MTIVNEDSRVVNKLEASLTDDARVVIYNRHMFIVQATNYIYRHKHISFSTVVPSIKKRCISDEVDGKSQSGEFEGKPLQKSLRTQSSHQVPMLLDI
jgi:hypothetical protein